MHGIIAGSLTAPALCGPAFAGPLVDGNVTDWGLTVGDGNVSNFSNCVGQDPAGLLDPIAPATEVQLSGEGGKHVGTADLVYTPNADPTTQRSVIELSIDRGIFVGATALDIWAPSCGNDVLEINDDLPARVPEPGTLGTLAACLLASRWVGRRR
jgi:hypothetical protein